MTKKMVLMRYVKTVFRLEKIKAPKLLPGSFFIG
jgi:hypothetical protein